MAFNRDQILAEMQRRGLQAPTAATAGPSREQVMAEISKRGLGVPELREEAFGSVDGFTNGYHPLADGEGFPHEDVPYVGQEADVPYFGGAAPQAPQMQPERTLGERAAGIGETALSALTGATGGSIGMMGGTIEGLYEAYKQGKLGTPEGADIVERTAMERSGQLTYAPRTEAGQEYAGELGELAAPMQAMGPGIATARPRTPKPGRVRAAPVAAKTVDVEAPLEDVARSVTRASGGGIGSGRAAGRVAEYAAPDLETVASAERLGVTEYLQPDHVTTSQSFREIAGAAKSQVGSKTMQAELIGLEQVAKKADDIITELGGTDDWSTLSQNVKTGMAKTQSDLFDQADSLYGKLSESIDPKAPVSTDNVMGWIGNQIDELGGAENLSPVEQKVFKRLSPKDGKAPSYALLDKTRKELAAARVKKEGIFADGDTFTLKHLEKELLNDQRVAAEAAGMGEVFENARKSVAIRKSLESDMSSLFGKKLDASIVAPLSTGMRNLTKGDVSSLSKTLRAIPENMRNEVVASGLVTAFGNQAKGGRLNFNSYSNWYEGLSKNKEALALLKSNLPKGSMQQLQDLYNVSNGIRKANKEYITTGKLMTAQDALKRSESMLAKVFDKAGPAGIGLAAGSLGGGVAGGGVMYGIVKSLSGGKKSTPLVAADNLLSSVEFRNLAKDVARNGEPSPASVRNVARSGVFKRYVKAVGGLGMSPEAFFLGTQQGQE